MFGQARRAKPAVDLAGEELALLLLEPRGRSEVPCVSLALIALRGIIVLPGRIVTNATTRTIKPLAGVKAAQLVPSGAKQGKP